MKTLGVLTEEKHGRLIDCLEAISHDAGVAPRYIYSATPRHALSDTEIGWVTAFRRHKDTGVAGLVYFGQGFAPSVTERMSLIAGALTRNAIRARLFQASVLAKRVDDGDQPTATCLLVPNFYEGLIKNQRDRSAARMLVDVLLGRAARGEQTVVYIADRAAFATDLGDQAYQLVAESFIGVEASA